MLLPRDPDPTLQVGRMRHVMFTIEHLHPYRVVVLNGTYQIRQGRKAIPGRFRFYSEAMREAQELQGKFWRVSLNNRHECRECFCCACVHVLRRPKPRSM